MRFIGLFLLSAAAFAQTGAISGKVVNLPGELVPNAPIVATNVATKAVYKSTSSDKGLYTRPAPTKFQSHCSDTTPIRKRTWRSPPRRPRSSIFI